MNKSRKAFEQRIKSLPSYQKQLFIHGERLFIIENGQYKIAAIQMAWELEQVQQAKIDELEKQNRVLSEQVQNLTGGLAEMQKERNLYFQDAESKQKRINTTFKHLEELDKQILDNPIAQELSDRIFEALRGGQ